MTFRNPPYDSARKKGKAVPLPGPSRGADHSLEPEWDPDEIDRVLREWRR